MSKGGAIKQPYYYMSIDYGVCFGQVDQINQVFVKEKPIWCGNMTTYGSFLVDQPDLFGGPDAEGGVVGMVECYIGSDDQKMSTILSGKYDLTPDTAPGYRGVTHLFFRNESGEGGFQWSVNNPYLPATWVNVTRLPKQIAPDFRAIWPLDKDGNDPLSSGTIPLVPTDEILCPFGGPGDACRGGPVPSREAIGDATWVPIPSLWIEDEVVSEAPRPGDLDATVNLDIFQEEEPVITDIDIDHSTVTFTTTVDVVEDNAGVYNKWATVEVCKAQYDEFGNPSPDETTKIQQSASGGGGTGSVSVSIVVPADYRYLRVIWSWSGIIFSGGSVTGEAESTYNWVKLEYGHCAVDGTPGLLPDANPAIMLHEAMTNEEWGMGYPVSTMGDSFAACAETLYDERFGLSMGWYQQATIEKMVTEIIDHINAMVYLDQTTGQWEMKLIRGDYDPSGLRVFTPENCKAVNRQRKATGEIINEIVINYTDPASEETKTISFQDPGTIAMQGGIVSSSRDYYGVRNDWLANQLGARDIRTASYPLFSCQLYVDRGNRDLRPGDVVKLTWPEDGISEMVVRIMKVDYGGPLRRRIVLDVTEDIFALENTNYQIIQPTQWVNPNTKPTSLDSYSVVTAPLPLLLRSGYTLEDLSDDLYPDVFMAVFGYKTGMSVFGVHGPTTGTNGEAQLSLLASLAATPSAPLATPLVAEAYSVLAETELRTFSKFLPVRSGDFIQIGDDETSAEIVMVDTFDSSTKEWTIARGMFDTVPRNWDSGVNCWYLQTRLAELDTTGQLSGSESYYRFTPKMSGGQLSVRNAPEVPFTPSDRPYAPFRPANVQIDGNGFAATEYQGGLIPATVELTWENRNRLLEDASAPRWDAGTISPEVGQTTTVRVREPASGDVVLTQSGLTGTSYTLDISGLVDYRDYDIEFYSERDGFESVQFSSRRLTLIRLGYGNNYGYDYGENDGG